MLLYGFDSLDHSHFYIYLSCVGGRRRGLQRQFHWDVSAVKTNSQPPVALSVSLSLLRVYF